jgi:hypothetical protein
LIILLHLPIPTNHYPQQFNQFELKTRAGHQPWFFYLSCA